MFSFKIKVINNFLCILSVAELICGSGFFIFIILHALLGNIYELIIKIYNIKIIMEFIFFSEIT